MFVGDETELISQENNNEEINEAVTVEGVPQMWGKKITVKCVPLL